MDIVNIVGLLSGGVGVFLLKFYTDWRKNKRGDTKDVVGAWQQIADRESVKYEKLEARVTLLERIVFERDAYIRQLEQTIISAGLSLPGGTS